MNSTISAASLLPHYFRVYFIAFTTLFLLAADADGQSPVHIDSARTLGSGTQVTVAGWVTTQDLINGHVFIQDETAGIGVASSELADITEIGDSVVVTGTLSYFGQSPFPAGRTDGMLRLSGTLTYTHYPDAQRVMQPRVITLAQVNSGAYEGQLVKIRQAPVYDVGTTQYPTGNFQGNIEYTTRILEDASRVFIGEGTNIPGTPAPQSEVDLTGIIDQNRGNFRIHPRSTDDLTANPFSAPPSEQTLDVMTWNIEWFGDTSNGPSNVELQRQNVRQIVQAAAMDLIALQEIASPQQFQQLIDELEHYDGFLSSSGLTQRLAILYDTRTITAVSHTNVATSGNWGQRNPLEFTFDYTPEGTTETWRIKATNLHAKAFSTLQDYNTRVSDAGFLYQYAVATNRNNYLIILGDYNDDVVFSTYNSNPSPYQVFNDDERFNIVTRALSLAGATSFRDRSMIDHIMINEKLFEFHLDRLQQVYDPDPVVSNYLNTTSDHYPVTTRFEFATETSIATDSDAFPSKITLENNFPNPFNPQTTIRFSLAETSTVSLRVYDLTGRIVGTLLDESVTSAGTHSVSFDGTGLSSGMYLYVLQSAGGVRLTGKMMLLK